LRAMLLLIASCFVWQQATASNRQWYTLTIDGKRVGYAWHDHDSQTDSEVTRVDVEELRQRVTVGTHVEVIRSSSGLPQRIYAEFGTGSARDHWQGTFSADARTITATNSTTAEARTFSVAPDLVLPDRLIEVLGPLWRHERHEIDFQYLDDTVGLPVRMHAEQLSSPDPRVTAIQLRAVVGTSIHNEVISLGEEGRVIHRERKFYGATLVWDRCLSDCESRINAPFDVMSRLVVPSPYRIPKSAFAGPIRYILSRVDGAAPQIPPTGEQSVVVDGSSAVLTVCTMCGVAEQLTESERRRYLQPNAWVQSDLPEIRSFANRHGQGRTQNEIMNNLVNAVRNHMSGPVDYLGYASAGEALRSRSGDCTEFAVLLAALARARDIPARVAYGLVYADRFSGKKDVFSPHVWVQVWTGERWKSYDAGIGEFDATHLALSLGDGDPRGVQTGFATPADLRIEKLGRVH
jgi:hypothetical protein